MEPIKIDVNLVSSLIQEQFPNWSHLTVVPVANGGWDNRVFRLGKSMLVRLPSHQRYALQVVKEQTWLPLLAPHLSLQIPKPIAMGKPSNEYPWNWSIYEWIEGEVASQERIGDGKGVVKDLARFLHAFQAIDTSGGPQYGEQNFFCGGPLQVYDLEARKAIAAISKFIDSTLALRIWVEALAANFEGEPVWVHGDISSGNLLVVGERLKAVIDFGCLGVGDPACDYAIAWMFFNCEQRNLFLREMQLDEGTLARARGWALWKAALTFSEDHDSRSKLRILDSVLDI